MKDIDYWLYSIWSLCGSMILVAWIVHWLHVMYCHSLRRTHVNLFRSYSVSGNEMRRSTNENEYEYLLLPGKMIGKGNFPTSRK